MVSDLEIHNAVIMELSTVRQIPVAGQPEKYAVWTVTLSCMQKYASSSSSSSANSLLHPALVLHLL
jgi:hypothetical protein